MESHSLQSASTYLNNLLLSRGLLQNGKAINFAQPDYESGGTDTTMSRIINLVHDLILRRDRDSEQREALATNIRALRADETQRVLDMQRVQDKNVELMRNLSMAEAQDRTLKANVRKAEAQARELKEQMLKMKSMLDQVRAKCLSDVRKRDTEIEKLKGHITGMQRGKREASAMKINVINPQAPMLCGKEVRGGQDVNSTGWSLEKETNDFLAALVNETSTENVALRQIVGDTMDVLQELTGLEHEQDAGAEELEEDGIGIPGQYRKSRRREAESTQEETLISCDTLASNMNMILEHCRSILKDPSFVPIEEVQIREEEIIKLRVGWEKMANRWKEAVTMMDSWRRKMLEGGESVNIQELSDLGFGRSMAVLPNGQPVLGQEDEASSILFDTSKMDAQNSSEDESNIDLADAPPNPPGLLEEESELDIPAVPTPKRLAASPARRGMRLPRPPNALLEINSNLRQPPNDHLSQISLAQSGDSGIGNLDESMDAVVENDTFQSRPRSRIPRQVCEVSQGTWADAHQRQAKKENIPPLTVSQKLAAIEAEAKEAEERRQHEEVTHKRKATRPEGWRKATRRRSTLSPDELATLMGVR
jgi:Afadin- and alpha -actinin-Binding